MKILLGLALVVVITTCGFPQSFEVGTLQESYKGGIGDIIKAPVRIKNTSDKSITLIIRKVSEQIGSTQRNYFCADNNCLEQRADDYVVKLEPGQILSQFQIGLEAGLVPGLSTVKYLVFNKLLPGHAMEFDLHFTVDEKPQRQTIYQSRNVILHDVYPNPSVDFAYVDYRITSERVSAKIRVHNILGSIVGEYDLPPGETIMRINTNELNGGIYFYTLCVDNESVMTRKLIVKK